MRKIIKESINLIEQNSEEIVDHDPIDMEYKLGYEDYRKGVPLDTNRSIYYQQGWLDEERWMLE